MLLFYGFWALFAVVVMLVDRNMRTEEDFTPSPGGYFVLAAISPFLVLPVYFYSARRSSTTGMRLLAALAGVALTIVCAWLAACHLTYVALLFRLVTRA